MSEPALVNASVEDARARMIRALSPLAGEEVALEDALGRVLAANIAAMRDQPPFPASAMDGYAVRAADTPGRLKLVGESAAGAGYAQPLRAGECARIFTGAPLPDGADCVAIQEDVHRDGDLVDVPQTEASRHVRARAIDFKAGDTMLHAGDVLDGVALTLAAGCGAASLWVRRRPRVAILATGDEIVPPGSEIAAHQIYESVSFGLKALVESWGGSAFRLKPQRDDVDAIVAAAREGFEDADLVVTIGGASVGDRDLVKPAFGAFALALEVDKIAVRPGKPTWFGLTSSGPALGLPGNPASALVCAHLFLKPIVLALLGREAAPSLARAHLGAALPQNGPREHYLRARLSIDDQAQLTATPFEAQDSSLMRVFHDADALVRLPPNANALDVGALIDIVRLDRLR
ncbi:MAG: molybdopterin molybdotransferase MoeA [Hyphomonadaceae bacterium]|nr:molybdopterin molybdotransferase MoeA [Hyphomonadaceae bacterium]